MYVFEIYIYIYYIYINITIKININIKKETIKLNRNMKNVYQYVARILFLYPISVTLTWQNWKVKVAEMEN